MVSQSLLDDAIEWGADAHTHHVMVGKGVGDFRIERLNDW